MSRRYWDAQTVPDPNIDMDAYHSSSDTSRPSYHSSSVPFKLDEGFSEALPSQDENGQTLSAATAANFQDWVMAQNEDDRAEIAYEVLRTLRTSNIAAVVDRLTPLLHMDPVHKLPPEITSEVFAYLDAHTLLTASLASRTWRERILDSSLWKRLYDGQGWGFDTDEIRSFDSLHASLLRSRGKGKAHNRDLLGNSGQPQHKKRATLGWLDHRARQVSADTSRWREQHGRIEADTDDIADGEDHEMQDAPNEPAHVTSPRRPKKRHSQDSGDEMELFSPPRREQTAPEDTYIPGDLQPPLKPALLQQEPSGIDRVNWPFLYKQRRRLEENWSKGRYRNFQLPHPSYLHEAHTECVYTIQFYGKWLVSGSRDKTLRIWDLDSRRLRGKPLTGHTQSVLCLQFDPTEGEDVIISGSSDTSVIVWRFSTGQKIQELPQAHTESVLNLRFDHRYLVTCSKDKLIKIWNRHEMLPSDPDYPRVSQKSEARIPSYIIDITQFTPTQLAEKIDFQQIKALRPYTNLMILRGHAAAVNAIQIDRDQIVSASGDRHIKLWDVKNGKCLRTIQGHQKGIACVQFDSRRIVSGSSDNTVRIFDPSTGAEVAMLQGHSNLVRTVQAGFGDLPGSEEDFDTQARAAERDYIEGLRNGTITDDLRAARRRPRTSSSNAPNAKRVAFGATLPPGGGGSQWGRIVSGSYDESIIIWKKDANGDWVIGQKLRQEAAVRAVADAHRVFNGVSTRSHPVGTQTTTGGSAPVGVAGTAHMPIQSASQIVQQAMNASMSGLSTGVQNVLSVGSQLHGPLATWNLPPATQPAAASSSTSNPGTSSGNNAMTGIATGWLGPGAQQAMHQLTAHAQNVMQAAINGQAQQQQQLYPLATPTAHHAVTVATGPAQTQPTITAVNGNGAGTFNPPPQPQQGQPGTQQSVSRVFKLQFDARRIVCCSQDSRIIGWDFANGDGEIAEASKFFLGP